MKKPSSEVNLEQFKERCHEHGLRVTPQRIGVYEEVLHADNHPTAEQVYASLRTSYPHISLNTVNETLITFSRIGLLEVVEGFGSARRYDPNLEPHHHIHCTQCGKIVDFESEEFDSIKPPRGVARDFDIHSSRVILTGTCDRCRRSQKIKLNR